MIQTLQLTQFKSYKNGLFEFSDGVNIIVGANASGKTNLLEALHVICQLKGFRVGDKQLIQFDQPWSRIEAMTDDGVRAVKLKPSEKSLDIDGQIVKRISASSGIPVVVFEPEHMLLLSNEPERRRAYLDGLLAVAEPEYKKTLNEYKRVLKQRNNVLKQPTVRSEDMFPWNIQLAEKAGYLVQKRLKLLRELQPSYSNHYKAISNSNDELQVSYESSISKDATTYSDELSRYLEQEFARDLQRGFTGAGPHRDDLLVELNGHDVRTTASRGETRSIVLALKVAELELVAQSTEKTPVLLLDDVFSELDGSRRRALAESLSKYQTFLTTTDADVAVDHFSDYNIIPISIENQGE